MKAIGLCARQRRWLAGLCLLLAPLLIAQRAAAEQIDLQPPLAGESRIVAVRDGAVYGIDALPLESAQPLREDDDLLFLLPDDSSLRLRGWWAPDSTEERARLHFGGTLISAERLLWHTQEEAMAAVEPAAGDKSGSHGGDFAGNSTLRGGFQTARRLLLRGEQANPAFGFHSYLLFSNAAPAGPAFERRKAAVQAYFSTVSSLAAMLSLGFDESELNVFWLPLAADGASAQALHDIAAGRNAQTLVPQVLAEYDFDRARALLARLRLRGDGPWIVSHPQPLSATALPQRPQQLLVQDLSRAPPKLVRRWVMHFMRRLEDDPGRIGTRLESFLLSLRGEISNLADGLSVTREAVAMTLGAGSAAAATSGDAAGRSGSTANLATASGARRTAVADFAGGAGGRAGVQPGVQSSVDALGDDALAAGQPVAGELAVSELGEIEVDGALLPDTGSAAMDAWLRAQAALAVARESAALNRSLLASRRALLGWRLWRDLGAARERRVHELQDIRRSVAEMVDSGAMGRAAEYEVQAALATARADLLAAERRRDLTAMDWSGVGEGQPAAAGEAAVDPQRLPPSPTESRRLAQRWHPALRLRSAEREVAEAAAARGAEAGDCLAGSRVGAELLDLRPRCAPPPAAPAALAATDLTALREAAGEAAAAAWITRTRLAEEASLQQRALQAAAGHAEALAEQFAIGQRSLQSLLEAMARQHELRERHLQRRHEADVAAWELLLAIGQLAEAAVEAAAVAEAQ